MRARALPGNHLLLGDGRAMSSAYASESIRDLLRLLGLKSRVGRVGPRPYDLRHAFAVQRLTLWHRAGVDVNARLPWLSAYMGHDGLLGTEVCLKATSELLGTASRGLRSRLHRGERP